MVDLATALTTLYMVVIFITGLLGNLTTIIVICSYHELQSTTFFYILNLAIADLLMALIIPLKLVLVFQPGDVLCKASVFFTTFFFNASVLAIYLIAIDRYVFICRPLYYRTHVVSTKIHAWILIAWLLALVISVLPFTGLANAPAKSPGDICKYSSVMSENYLAFVISVTELLPPLVFIVMYGKIMVVARRHAIEIAIQFTNSKPFKMDWLQRRKLTETLMAPFENPTYLLDKAGRNDNEEAKAIREILYKNYNNWRTKQAEMRRKLSVEDVGEDDEVFEPPKTEPAAQGLSKVGHGLRQWRTKALSVSTAPKVDNPITNALSNTPGLPLSQGCTVSVRTSSKTNIISVSGIEDFVDEKEEGKLDKTRLRPKLVRYFSSKRGLSSVERTGEQATKWRRTQNVLRVFSKRKQKSKVQVIKIKKEFKAVKMLGLVVGMFILFNVPIGVIDMMFISKTVTNIPVWLVRLALCLTHSNPAVNPLIYVITRRQFRMAYVKLWSCGRYKTRLSECSYA